MSKNVGNQNTSERIIRLESAHKLILDKLENSDIRQHSDKKKLTKKIDRLEADNILMRNKLKLDSETADIRFQLMQKALDELQQEIKKKSINNNELSSANNKDVKSAFHEINFIKQNIARKYNEFKRVLENVVKHMKAKDQQIQALTEQLEGVKKNSLVYASPTQITISEEEKFNRMLRDRDDKLTRQIGANDQLLLSMKTELDQLRKIAEGQQQQQHRALEFDDSDFDDRETYRGDRETFIGDDDDDHDDDDELKDDTDEIFNTQDLEHLYLPNDTYSYFAVAKYVTGSGWTITPTLTLAIFALLIQLVTLTIFVMDVFNIGNAGNLIAVPPAVDVQVRASQFVALLISCWNQDEVRASFNVLSLGYNPEKVFAISPHSNPTKWYFSICVRILLGCYSLLVTFVLIVKSETVRDVMLDFAAVTFVSELDNGAFLLSLWGYMGKDVQKLTMRIKNLPISESFKKRSQKQKKIPRLASLTILITVIIGFWLWITVRQEHGVYMDQHIFVQFGDDFSPEIGAFSGLYKIKLDESSDGIRVNYVDFETKRARFSYCSADGTWIFQYGENPIDYSDFDCWSKAKSSETEELDITKAATVTWYVVEKEVPLDMPLQHFYVNGREHYYGQDCESNDHCGDRMECSDVRNEKGSRLCVCNDGMFGLNCEFPEPCRSLDIDPRNPNGFFGTRSWSRRYSSLREDGKETPFQVYGKPIYFGDESIEEELLHVDVMLFTGRRWILTDSSHMEDYQPSTDRSARDLAKYLAESFHAYFSNYNFYFASEPVDVGTPKYAATPVGLQWFRLETSGARGVSLRSAERIWAGGMNIEANLFCAVCNNETNPCFYGSTCRSDGTCDCTTGASGRLCQIPPDGNGLCDKFFNTPEFSFDGGDCCEETCISTEDYTCGNGMIENSAGVSAYGFVGFPNCQDPRFSAKLSGSTTLYQIIERGALRCGGEYYPGFLEFANGNYSGLEADLCKSIASAALGDPEAIEIIQTTSSDRFSDLADGKFDVLIRRTTHTAERDVYQSGSKVGFSFASIPAMYDGLRYGGIPPYSECADKLDFESATCRGLKICVAQDYSWYGVTQRLFPDSIVVGVQSDQAEVDGLEAGVCNVIAGEITFVAEFSVRERGFTGPVYELGENVYSKEPLSAVTRQNDRVWSKFVSWVFEALIQAEELSITKLTADRLAPTDVFGEEFSNMFQNAVAANGNYGEIYEKNLEDKIPRSGLNNINRGDSGLIYAFPFGAIETRGSDPIVGGSIEGIRKRGTLNCGISKSPGFGSFDSETGIWTGFEVDMCRGIAAALFSGSPNVNFIPLTTSDRFTALADGAVDVMACTTTHTLTREMKETDTGEGFDFTPAIFYDGLGFGGRPPFVLCAEILSFDTFALSSECPDTRICVVDSTTSLDTMLGVLNIPEINIFITSSTAETYERFVSGDCNVIAGESARIAEASVRENGYPDGEDYFVSSVKFTREPLAVVSRSDDQQFSDFLRWIIHGFFFAAEQGITRSEYFNMPATNFLFGEALSGMWLHAIAAVGNYNEMFDRNFAGLRERGGPNNLNDKSGPQFHARPGVVVN